MNTHSVPPRRGLAITSLVLGIIAFVLSFVAVGAVLGLLGLAFGLLHIRARRGDNISAWWGVALSISAMITGVALGFFYFKSYEMIRAAWEQSGNGNNDVQEWEGVLAPNITVKTLSGETVELNSLRGKRVILDFWATWCPPCVEEIPHFIQLHNETSRDELVIVGVSDEDEATLKPFVQKHKINYTIGTSTNLVAPFDDIDSIPTTFFIDRNGVIQSIAVGYRELDDIKQMALGDDYAGEPKPAPAPVPPEAPLTDAAEMFAPVQSWSTNIPAATALAVGDWDAEEGAEILVIAGNRLHVLAPSGALKSSLTLPASFGYIEVGRSTNGVRLLGFSNWERNVIVMDATGKQLWKYGAMTGIDGAHWGDLNADGNDEVIIGMNGFSGLHAVSPDGKKLWSKKIGNVWNQAVIPATEDRDALVFATEAGGTVRVYDAQGKSIRTIRPKDSYSTQMTASVMNAEGDIQVIAVGEGTVIAMNEQGHVAWSTPTDENIRTWIQRTFASGDINGDGQKEWAFHDDTGDLIIVTAAGEKLATLKKPTGLQDFIFLPGEKHQLLLLDGTALRAYRFDPAQ